MNISSKVANFIFAVALTVSPVSGKIIEALPYIQIAAASTVFVNNGLQIASKLNPSKR